MLGASRCASSPPGKSSGKRVWVKLISANSYNCLSQIVEKAYQKTKNFDKLSFLYLTTGSTDKLTKMQAIADARGDPMSRFHTALYTGDVEARISVLRDVGMCKLDQHPSQPVLTLNDRPSGILDRKNQWIGRACS